MPLSNHARYDGLSRRVKIVEKTGATVTSAKQFVWDDMTVAEERDGSGNLTKRFYSQGQVNGSTALFYSHDHLGSVREVTSAAGTLQARYDYDPYGRRTLMSGSDVADFGFTAHYYHAPSKFDLTLYRAYDIDSARWIGRDPLEEKGGWNLYAYVANNPIGSVDPDGRQVLEFFPTELVEEPLLEPEFVPLPGPSSLPGAPSPGPGGLGLTPPAPLLEPQPKPASPTPTRAQQPESVPPQSQAFRGQCDNRDPECSKARPWQLIPTGIRNEHKFKEDILGVKAKVAAFDICACKDGSTVLKTVKQCGMPGPSITTGERWK